MPITFEPVDDQVVFQPLKHPGQSDGGILLPDNHLHKVAYGRVVATGPGRWASTATRVPPYLKPGDEILVPAAAGFEFRESGTDYRVLFESNVISRVLRS